MSLSFQNSRNVASFIPATQSQTTCYSEYDASHDCRDATAAAEQPAVGYAQADVEQWVRQQNASRQKQQQQMAASSVYPGQAYRSCNQIPESGQYRYWSGVPKLCTTFRPMSSGSMSSSVDLMRSSGRYGNTHAAVHVQRHFHHDNYKIPDDNLTMEQRQQRQSKMGRLQLIQQMISTDPQAVPDECMEQVATGGYLQSRGPWNSVPCADDMYTGPYSSGNGQLMNTMRHHSHTSSWDMMTAEQHRWYHMQRERYMNKMAVQKSFCHCRPTNSDVRYFDPRTAVNLSAEPCQMPVRERVLPAYGVCDYTHVYASCDPHVCTCGACMTKQYHSPPSGMYGYTDVSMQPNYGCQQEMNRCDEFVTDKYFANSSQVGYDTSYKGPAVGWQNWNSGDGGVRQHVMPALVRQQFDVPSQQVALTRRPNNSYCADGNVVTEPVSAAVACAAVAAMPSVATVRPRQPGSNRKRKNNSSTAAAAQPSVDSKSKKLDSDAGEWPLTSAVSATRSGTLMNITSASLAHLAKGVENISAVMQQTVQQGGPFRYIQGPGDDADASDENANFIRVSSSLPGQAHSLPNPAYNSTSVTLPLTSFQASGSYSGAASTPSHTYSSASTTGVNVVIVSKAPYTISYRPTGISSETDSEDVKQDAFSHSARTMQQQSCVERRMSSVGTAASSSHRHTPSNEGLSEPSRQENCAMITSHENPSDAAKVDHHPAAAAAAADCGLSMASSVAVIQPQMMSGTQLFIADCSSDVTAPLLNDFVLPTSIPPSSAFMSLQQSHFMQRDTSYQTLAMHHVSVTGGGSNVTNLRSPVQSVEANTDELRSLVCTAGSKQSWSSSVAGGGLPVMSRYAQASVAGWHQPSLAAGNGSLSQTHDDKYAVQNALPVSGVGTTPT